MNLTGQVSASDSAVYFLAGKCGSEMTNEVENADNLIFSTEIETELQIDESLGIVATNQIPPIEFACTYSRNLDSISYAPAGLQIFSSDEVIFSSEEIIA